MVSRRESSAREASVARTRYVCRIEGTLRAVSGESYNPGETVESSYLDGRICSYASTNGNVCRNFYDREVLELKGCIGGADQKVTGAGYHQRVVTCDRRAARDSDCAGTVDAAGRNRTAG